jgi:hypothetical protein
LSTWVTMLAVATNAVTTTVSSTRPRASAITATTMVATAREPNDTALSTVLASPSTRSWPMALPSSATVSSNCPRSVRTKNRHSNPTPAAMASPSTTSQAAGNVTRPSRTFVRTAVTAPSLPHSLTFQSRHEDRPAQHVPLDDRRRRRAVGRVLVKIGFDVLADLG